MHYMVRLYSVLPSRLHVCSPCPRSTGRWGDVLLWGGGGGPSRPVPSFPLRRKILAQRGSLLVSVYLVLVALATCFCWPTYPSLS